jgi:hypothetical protein
MGIQEASAAGKIGFEVGLRLAGGALNGRLDHRL